MKILKFGGSSLCDPCDDPRRRPDSARRAPEGTGASPSCRRFRASPISCSSARGSPSAPTRVPATRSSEIARRHRAAVTHARRARPRAGCATQVDALLAELRSTLQGIHLLRHCPLRALDMTASFGERLSALIVAAYLERSHPAGVRRRARLPRHRRSVHARERAVSGRPTARTRAYFARLFRAARRASVPVVTGFIGATADGQTTTIGRNGSDYSAAIVGAAVGASVIEIWTDVDGVLSADPRVVPAAFVLPQMTYEEAMELSYFGAKVLHSATIAPAVAKRIPILIKNTFNPAAPGTLISRKRGRRWDSWRRGSRSVGDLSLLTLRGPGMVGVPGVAERLFRTLAAKRRQRHPDLAGVVRAHDLLRGPQRRRGARRSRRSGRSSSSSSTQQLMQVDVTRRPGDPRGRRRGDEGAAGRGREGVRLARPATTSTSARSRRARRSATSRASSTRRSRCARSTRSIRRSSRRASGSALAMIGVGNIGGARAAAAAPAAARICSSQGFDVTVVGAREQQAVRR